MVREAVVLRGRSGQPLGAQRPWASREPTTPTMSAAMSPFSEVLANRPVHLLEVDPEGGEGPNEHAWLTDALRRKTFRV